LKAVQVRFRPQALQDIEEACNWYESQGAGLSNALLSDLNSVLDQIKLFPASARSGRRGKRLMPLRRFPYILVYDWDGLGLEVLAVFHSKKNQTPFTVHEG
jgi:plasmid stabilization system protein ParE